MAKIVNIVHADNDIEMAQGLYTSLNKSKKKSIDDFTNHAI